MKRKITEQDYEEIIKLYRKGFGSLTISRMMMINSGQVEYFLRNSGIRRTPEQARKVLIMRRRDYEHLPEWMR
jgi:hypothetical protein